MMERRSSWKAFLFGSIVFAAGAAFGQCVDCGTKVQCPEVTVTCPECPPGAECPPCPDLKCPDPCPDPEQPCVEIPLTIVPPATPTAAPAFRWDLDVHGLLMEDTNGAAVVATWNGRRPHRYRPTFGVAWLEGRDVGLTVPTLVDKRSSEWCCPVLTETRQDYAIDDQWGVVLGVTIGLGRN